MPWPSSIFTVGFSTSAITSLTLPAYQVPAGSNKRLVVALHRWNFANNVVAFSSNCSHSGVNMGAPRAASTSSNANGGASTSSAIVVWDLILGSSEPLGDIVVSWSGSNQRATLIACTIEDVVQTGGPTVGVNQSLGPTSVTTALTDLVFDFVSNDAQNVAGGNFSVTPDSFQATFVNTRIAAGTAGEANFAMSGKGTTTPTTSMTWSGAQSLGPRSQHVVLAYASANPAVTLSFASAGGGAAIGGVIKSSVVRIASTSGGASLVGLVKSAVFGTAVAGGGAVLAGAVKSAVFGTAVAGGGAVLAGFTAFSFNIANVPIPAGRTVQGAGGLPGIAAPAIGTITIGPVGKVS